MLYLIQSHDKQIQHRTVQSCLPSQPLQQEEQEHKGSPAAQFPAQKRMAGRSTLVICPTKNLLPANHNQISHIHQDSVSLQQDRLPDIVDPFPSQEEGLLSRLLSPQLQSPMNSQFKRESWYLKKKITSFLIIH